MNANNGLVPISRAVVPAAPTTITNLTEIESLAQHFVKSGYFKDARQVSQAVVKIVMGNALGIDPASAMAGLFLSSQGKLCMSANLMAATIKRSHKYDYRIREKTATRCVVEYFEKIHGKLISLGTEETCIEDFKHLTSEPWKRYPKNMLFARNISNGAKFFCPDAFGGSPVYLPDELPNNNLIVDGETLEVTATPETSPGVSGARAALQAAMDDSGVTLEWLNDVLSLNVNSLDDLTEAEIASAYEMLTLRTIPSKGG